MERQLTIDTYDPDSPRGIVLRMWNGLASALTPLGNDAVANVIGSQTWRAGVLELDRLAVADDIEGTKQCAKQLYHALLGLGQAAQTSIDAGEAHAHVLREG